MVTRFGRVASSEYCRLFMARHAQKSMVSEMLDVSPGE